MSGAFFLWALGVVGVFIAASGSRLSLAERVMFAAAWPSIAGFMVAEYCMELDDRANRAPWKGERSR